MIAKATKRLILKVFTCNCIHIDRQKESRPKAAQVESLVRGQALVPVKPNGITQITLLEDNIGSSVANRETVTIALRNEMPRRDIVPSQPIARRAALPND